MTLALTADAQDLLFREARTANAFTDEPVTDEQVRAIYELVKYAPTSMNANPLRIVLARSDEARARVIARMAEGNRAKTASAPLIAVVAADVDFHDELGRLFPHFAGARAMFAEDELAREQVAVRNGMLQLGYVILGVRAAGLAAGPMAGMDTLGLEKDFFPGGRHRVLAVVNIGQPAPEGAWQARLPRLDYADVVTAA